MWNHIRTISLTVPKQDCMTLSNKIFSKTSGTTPTFSENVRITLLPLPITVIAVASTISAVTSNLTSLISQLHFLILAFPSSLKCSHQLHSPHSHSPNLSFPHWLPTQPPNHYQFHLPLSFSLVSLHHHHQYNNQVVIRPEIIMLQFSMLQFFVIILFLNSFIP